MVSYILETESELWDAYKDTIPRSKTLDEPLIRYVIERVMSEQGRDAVPDAYLAWYDGERAEMPRLADAE